MNFYMDWTSFMWLWIQSSGRPLQSEFRFFKDMEDVG
jgi:hypothetical protein